MIKYAFYICDNMSRKLQFLENIIVRGTYGILDVCNGCVMSVFSEHWVLLAFVNGPKLNDRDRDAWKQLFKDNRAITITVDGPRFEECTVDLSKPCFILVDSALEYDLAVK